MVLGKFQTRRIPIQCGPKK